MALRVIAARTRSSALRLAAPAPLFSPPATRVFTPAAPRPASFYIAPPVMSPVLSAPRMELLTRPISRAALCGGIVLPASHVRQARCMSSLPSWMTTPSASDPAEMFSKLKPESKEALYLAHLMLSHLEEGQGHELLVLKTLLQEIQDGQDQLWSILGAILAVTAWGFSSLILFLVQVKDDTSNLFKGLSSNMGDIIPKFVSAAKHELPFYFGRGEPFVWNDAWTRPKEDKKGSGKEGDDAAKDKKGPGKGGQATEKKGPGKGGQATEKEGPGKGGQATEKKGPGKWF